MYIGCPGSLKKLQPKDICIHTTAEVVSMYKSMPQMQSDCVTPSQRLYMVLYLRCGCSLALPLAVQLQAASNRDQAA